MTLREVFQHNVNGVVAFKNVTQRTSWCFTSGHFYCFQTNQNRSYNGAFESRSFRQACIVRNEDSKYEIVEV